MQKNNQSSFDKYLTVDEEKQLFNTLKAHAGLFARRDYAWLRLLRHTGIRVGSLSLLTVDDAREAIKNKSLFMRAEILKGGLKHDAKSGKVIGINPDRAYAIPLNKHAVKALRDLLSIRTEQGHANVGSDPLVMSRKRQGVSIRTFQNRCQHWRDKAGLSIPATPHWFRHTVGQRIMETSTAADPQGMVQAALNHKNRSTTAIYTKPTKEALRKAMEEMS